MMEKTGLLVSPNNKKEILEAIKKLVDVSLRTKIITNAKEKAKLFSIEKTIQKTTDIIISLTQNREQGIFQNNIFLRYFVCGITATLVNLFRCIFLQIKLAFGIYILLFWPFSFLFWLVLFCKNL